MFALEDTSHTLHRIAVKYGENCNEENCLDTYHKLLQLSPFTV